MHMLTTLKVKYGNRICGVDICGEKANKGRFEDDDDFRHNNVVRHALLNKKIIAR